MADLAFDLEYDGPALEAHEMDVRELAPALLSAANLFQEVNRVMHPADPEVTVNVRATSEGSFLVQLKLVYDQTTDVLGGQEVTAAVNLGAILTWVSALIVWIKQRGSRPIVSQTPVEDQPGQVRVEFPDGTTVIVDEAILRLDRNLLIRQNLVEVTKPLERDGVQDMRIRRDNRTVAEVSAEDRPAFVSGGPDPREILASSSREAYLTLLRVPFQKGRMWRFTDGENSFNAVMRDEPFIERIDDGSASFSKLDVLHCRIRQVQWREPTGLKSETEVLQVIEHLHHDPGAQGEMFPDAPPPPPIDSGGDVRLELEPGDES